MLLFSKLLLSVLWHHSSIDMWLLNSDHVTTAMTITWKQWWSVCVWTASIKFIWGINVSTDTDDDYLLSECNSRWRQAGDVKAEHAGSSSADRWGQRHNWCGQVDVLTHCGVLQVSRLTQWLPGWWQELTPVGGDTGLTPDPFLLRRLCLLCLYSLLTCTGCWPAVC